MLSNPNFIEQNQLDSNILSRAKRAVRQLKWLSPIEKLNAVRGRDFGRSIEKSLLSVMSGSGVEVLKLRDKEAAVVVSIKRYEEMMAMKTLCDELIDRMKSKELHDTGSQFDDLFKKIAASRKGADAIFRATPEQLAATYAPGKTEVD